MSAYDVGDEEPPLSVTGVTDYTGPQDPYDNDSVSWGRVVGEFPPGLSEWKGYKNGGKVYLSWPELLRRWGPVTATTRAEKKREAGQ